MQRHFERARSRRNGLRQRRCIRLFEERDNVVSPLLLCDIQDRLSILVSTIAPGTAIEQKLHDLNVALAGKHQRRPAIFVLHLDPGSPLEQQLCHLQMPPVASQNQRRAARLVLRVEVGTFGDPVLHRFEMTRSACLHQRCPAERIPVIDRRR